MAVMRGDGCLPQAHLHKGLWVICAKVFELMNTARKFLTITPFEVNVEY